MRVYAACTSGGLDRGTLGVLVRVYAAAFATEQQLDVCELLDLGVLVSYENLRTRNDRVEQIRVDLMIDSGAFAVWKSGKTIDLDEYVKWCIAFREHSPARSLVFVNLDVIPGKEAGGAPPTKREVTEAAQASMRNADTMRAAGLPIMEVFHLGEPMEFFDVLLDRREPGVPLGLGGLAGRGGANMRARKRAFCDGCFHRLKERAGGWAGIAPLHGLGISPDAPLGRRYPWWSIDASSWTIPQRYGRSVTRSGRNQKDDTRTSVRPVIDLYFRRYLERWVRLQEQLTGMWDERGVTFAPDMAERVVA